MSPSLYLIVLVLWFTAGECNPCAKLTKCAVQKCFSAEKINNAIYNQSTDGMFATLIEQFSFLCVAGKCRSECRACENCQYALDQIVHLATGSKTEMLCPKMESCSLKCLRHGITHLISCVHKNCNIYCFDGDCPHCRSLAKRIFLDICRKHNIPDLPNIQYLGKCMNLFDEASVVYVENKRLKMSMYTDVHAEEN